MNATAQRLAAPSRTSTRRSGPGLGGPTGTMRGGAGSSGGGLRRPSSSSAAAVTRSLVLALMSSQTAPDREADSHERGRADQPGDDPFRDRPDVSERPAAAVVGVLRVLDVAN